MSAFDVFLSHNSKDKPAVRKLAEALRSRGLRVWLDEWELVPGRPWQEGLETIIQNTKSSVVLVGRDGVGPWENLEMRACLSQFVRLKRPVIPVLLPGAPQEPEIPLFLHDFTWVDLRGGITEEGLDRLEWGITGTRPGPAAPTAFTESLTGIRLLWIPGGRFQMGSNCYTVERPVHWVRISPFWLGETPVTNRQYATFLEKTGHQEPDDWRDPRFSSPDQPVVGVNWQDALTFCNWLSKTRSRKFLLPSEAQWEFAARGLDSRVYPWGDEPPDETRACFSLDYKESKPAPVVSYPAGKGPFGTLDQAGSVWEWCRDAYDSESYERRVEEGREPLDPVEGEGRTGDLIKRPLRGGSWSTADESWLRATNRIIYRAGYKLNDIGFRVATA